jgi:hypothetical protein
MFITVVTGDIELIIVVCRSYGEVVGVCVHKYEHYSFDWEVKKIDKDYKRVKKRLKNK